MKREIYVFVLILITVFMSCSKNDNYELYTIATPQYMTKEAFRSSVKVTAPREIAESGKIYVYNDYVLVNDVDKGIHVIDNSNPLNPTKKVFIEIIGNNDMEVKGDYLYADSFIDLVVFDISDINNVKEVSRIKEVFPNFISMPEVENLSVDYSSYLYDENQIQVAWKTKEEYREVLDEPEIVLFESIDFTSDAASGGEGGSLARFKIIEDYLYTVDNSAINIFDISNLESPIALHDVYVSFGIETIFNRGNYLFLGSTNGMYIYDITEANRPTYVSEFSHATACDPVVVDGNYAYVTLRGGNSCGAFESSLEIIDITDVQRPSLVKTYKLDNPYGLGIENDLLFICDGTSGLKVYNKENIRNLNLLKVYDNVTAYDVVPLDNRLIMIGGNILYQYNYNDLGLDLISEFTFN